MAYTQVAGLLLLALPFVVILVVMITSIGLRLTVLCFAISAAFVTSILLGGYLLTGSLD